VRVGFLKQTGFEGDPFFVTDLAFENGFLDSDTVVRTSAGHAAESFVAAVVGSSDIVSDKNKHELFGDEGKIVYAIIAQDAGKESSLDEEVASDSDLLIEDGMLERFAFTFLVSLDESFASIGS